MQWLFLILLLPYIYLLIKIYAGVKKIKQFLPAISPDLFVSVIVACRNEEESISSLLSDIAAQDYNPDLFEVVIVDDNSTDLTYKSATGFRGIKNLVVLRNTGSGKKKAIKTGVENCRGELVITTDADCRTEKNWLKTIASFYAVNSPEMIICQVEMMGRKGLFQRFMELEFLSLQGVTAGTATEKDPVMCNGANLAFTKRIFNSHSADLHAEKVSGDDIFLLHRIKRESGKKILWLESSEAKVTTPAPVTISAFLRQRARWISKAGSYDDRYTQVLAIVTFVTILLQLSSLIAGIFEPVFLLIFLAAFVLKSIPDFLILQNTAIRYKKKNLLWFFLPGQFLYPFYVISVLIYYSLTKSSYSQQTD